MDVFAAAGAHVQQRGVKDACLTAIISSMTSRRLIITIVSIAVGQTLLALTAFGVAFAIGDSGGAVPLWLNASTVVLATPGAYLSGILQEALGDPASSLVGFAVGGVLWGCVLGLLLQSVLTRRQRVRGPLT